MTGTRGGEHLASAWQVFPRSGERLSREALWRLLTVYEVD